MVKRGDRDRDEVWQDNPFFKGTYWLLEVELVVEYGIGLYLLHGVHVRVGWFEGGVEAGHGTVGETL